MGIGGSVLLIALGAILAFAVNWNPGNVSLHVIGWILMGAGALWLVILLSVYQRRRVVRTTIPPDARRPATRTDVVEERDPPDYYEP
jgi:hypothetical protein